MTQAYGRTVIPITDLERSEYDKPLTDHDLCKLVALVLREVDKASKSEKTAAKFRRYRILLAKLNNELRRL